ncbi:MAG TPA: IS110 family transposase [Acidiferrobacterales bacterium]|nr:IS110 family transposase [Acidiferrobacterales bacterium]
MNGSIGRWVGIDIAKSKLDVALLDQRGKLKSHVFANDTRGHAALLAWLREHAGATAINVCMEATGPYGEAVATTLTDAGLLVSVVNPARIKGFAQSELVRNKTDRADAALLARFGQTMQPEPWTAPPLEVRELRALVDRLQSLKEMHQQEANRLESAMNQPSMHASIQSHMQWLQASIKELEHQIDDHIDRHPGLRSDVKLITSIPGVGNTTAAKVLAYLGDVRRFKNGKALAAFIGVTPRLKLSGSSVHGRSVISRSGHAGMRHCLYMPAMVALKHNPLVSAFGIRLKSTGLAPKAVIAACMHKLVLLIYGILKSGTPFNPQFGAKRLDFQDGI